MPQNPPEGFPRITPYLFYEDVATTLEWLMSAFGFRERFRMQGEDGTVTHAEMDLHEAVVMMGKPGTEYRNPKKLGQTSGLVYVYVDDVDKHFVRAKEAGAKILTEPEDQFYGDRTYNAEDPEGHQWTFAQHVRDVAEEDMHP